MEQLQNFRSRNFALLLYPEDAAHMDALGVIRNGGYKYAAVLHDKDTYTVHDNPEEVGKPKKPHYHVVLTFPNDRWRNAMATELGITTNYLQKCTSKDGALLYLMHKGHPEKHQYEYEAVEGPLAKDLAKLLDETTEDERVLEIACWITDAPGKVTYTETLIRACKEKKYGDLRRLGSGVKWLIDEHNAIVDQRIYATVRGNAYEVLADSGTLDNMAFEEYVQRIKRQNVYKPKEEKICQTY